MTIPAPTLALAPTAEEVAAVTCPVDRARLLTRVARDCGTLSGPLAGLRRAALIEARNAGHRVTALARKVGLSPARISQITAVTEGEQS